MSLNTIKIDDTSAGPNIVLARNDSPAGRQYGIFEGCNPHSDLEDGYAEHTPIQIAPGMDPNLPPPPKNHAPNQAWKFNGHGWTNIPMPMKGEGGAYMYVDNVWQYVEQPKFYAYKMDTSTCTWRMVPPTAVSEQKQNAIRFNNQEAEGFPQALHDMLRQKWLNSWLGYSNTDKALTLIQAGDTKAAVGTIAGKALGDFFSIALVIGGIWLVIKLGRLWARASEKARKEWAEQQGRVHGSARWMEGEELNAYGMKGRDAKGLVIGLWNDGKTSDLIRFHEKGHLLTFAPTGAGKGVGSIIPNLLDYPGSFVCIDPKGENAVVTAAQRTRLGNLVLVLDPFQRTAPYLPGCQVSFNPLGMIDPDGPRAPEDAAILAEALVPTESTSSAPIWEPAARALLAALLRPGAA
ncbi:MAG: type IV secretory system conjugative DNA transfer family protein, partial [Burkholderiaceae bacterium]